MTHFHAFPLQMAGEQSGPPPAFEVLAITAGEGNGWLFPEQALRESLPLWDGAPCYIDHAWGTRSVRDLAGTASAPRWDETARGVRLTLTPGGPAADLLVQAGRGWLAAREPRPPLGFSADLMFEPDGRTARRIVRVRSLDLVASPARGGAFVAEQARFASVFLNQEGVMTEPTVSNEAEAGLRGALLDAQLAAARLPASLERRVRAQFSGRDFTAAELQTALDDARGLLSELSGAGAVRGGGRVEVVSTPEDQLTAAVHDLLGAERPERLRSLQTHRLSGIRELYTLTTGDHNFYGGFFPERAQFASTTASLPGLLKNAMNKLIVQQWQELGRSGYRWWEPIVSVQHFNSLHDLTGVLVGEVNVLPGVAEGAAYTELDVKDSPETAAWSKYGGFISITMEMIERDQTHKLVQFPRKLASAGLRRISALVGSVFTANAGAGPVMADTLNVFNAATHKNLGTAALTAATWETAGTAIYNQDMLVPAGATAPKLALDARYLLVPRALRLTGMQILYPSFAHEASFFSENMQRGEMGDVITCPEFTDANDWAALADPLLAPGIVVAERFGLLPEIFIADSETNGALFTNDQIRIKARHWLSVLVVDYRPLYKANVP